MFFRFIIMSLLLLSLLGCNLREDNTLPSGLSPFELIDDAIYITGEGLYATSKDNTNILVSQEESSGFEFVTESYNFTPSSQSYYIRVVDDNEEIIEVEDFFPLLALPTEEFTYLGFKYQGDYERFYPYPKSASINGYGAYYERDFSYFLLTDNGFYQTVSESVSHSTVTVEINPTETTDANVSLYQAQFVIPRKLIPMGVQRISLEKVESDNLAEYNLTLLNLPVMFNIIQNNPEAERNPILYLPVPPDTDISNILVKQILPDHREVVLNYSEEVDSYNQYTYYGNTIIIPVNNQGKFIINEQ